MKPCGSALNSYRMCVICKTTAKSAKRGDAATDRIDAVRRRTFASLALRRLFFSSHSQQVIVYVSFSSIMVVIGDFLKVNAAEASASAGAQASRPGGTLFSFVFT